MSAPTSPTLADLFRGMEPSEPIYAALEGTVYGEGDTPLPGAEVRVYNLRSHGQGPALAETETNAQGRYRLLRLPVETVVMEIHAAGYKRHRSDPDLSGLTSEDSTGVEPLRERRPAILDFHLEPGGLTLTGVVGARDTSDTIAGAEVILSLPDPRAAFRAVTDRDGRFALDGLPVGTASLVVMAEGYRAAILPSLRPGRDPMEVWLDRGGARITGLVLSRRTRRPVAEADIGVIPVGDSSLLLFAADSKGRFETAELPRGSYYVYAFSGYRECADHKLYQAEIGMAGESVWLELLLAEPMPVRGRVIVKVTGAPVQGAVVRLSQYNASHRPVGGGPAALTDEQGRFFLVDETEGAFGELVAAASAEGFLEGYGRVANPKGVEEPAPALIALEHGVVFRGAVKDSGDAPVAGAHLLGRIGPAGEGGDVDLESGSDGRFEERYSSKIRGQEAIITVSSRSGSLLDRFVWPPEATELEHDFRLEAGHDLTVRVTGNLEGGLGGLKIFLYGGTDASTMYRQDATTGDGGEAEFRALPSILLNAWIGRGEESLYSKSDLVDLSVADPPRSVVVALGKLMVHVTGLVSSSEGQALGGVRIRALSNSGIDNTETQADGRYELNVDRKDTYIRFQKIGYQEADQRVEADPDAESVVINATLSRQSVFFGRVVDREGKAMTGTMQLGVYGRGIDEATGRPSGSPFPVFPPVQTSLDSDGGFELAPPFYFQAARAAYAVLAFDSTRGSGWSEWRTFADGEKFGPFEVRFGWRSLCGRVLDADTGAPVAGALVTLATIQYHEINPRLEQRLAEQNRPVARSDASGAYELAPITAGEETVSVYHPDYFILKIPLTGGEHEETERRMDIRLVRGVRWRGTVVDSSGAPFPDWIVQTSQQVEEAGGSVRWYANSDPEQNATQDAPPGEFCFRGLRPEEVSVQVILPRKPAPPITVYYSLSVDLGAMGGDFRRDVQLPPLASVEIVVPPGYSRGGFHFLPVDAAGVKADGYFSGLGSSPTEVNATVWIPAGRYRIPPPDGGMGPPPQQPGAPAAPVAAPIEIDIRAGAPNRVVIPPPRPTPTP